MWSAILSAPAPPKDAAGRRSAGSTWGDPRNSPTHRRPKRGGGGRRARHLLNSPAATAWARARFHGLGTDGSQAMSLFDVSLETANSLYKWGWRGSIFRAVITAL